MSPSPTTVVLIRHGESQVTVDQVVGGHTACTGLSELGRSQAMALRDRLTASGLLRGAHALYSSVLARAVETAEIIAPGVGDGLTVTQRCALCELHVGEGDGLPWAEFVRRYGQPPWQTDPTVPLSPGSESWSAFTERATAGLQTVADEHAGEVVVVVCHGGVIEASFAAWGGLTQRFVSPENTALTAWSLDGGAWRLDRYNDSAHLETGFCRE